MCDDSDNDGNIHKFEDLFTSLRSIDYVMIEIFLKMRGKSFFGLSDSLSCQNTPDRNSVRSLLRWSKQRKMLNTQNDPHEQETIDSKCKIKVWKPIDDEESHHADSQYADEILQIFGHFFVPLDTHHEN